MAKTDLTAAQLRELLNYDAGADVFTWRARRGGTANAGSVAGGVRQDGYWDITICGRKYLAHRLVWLYFHGTWPADQLDHVNNNRRDNRLENLREATNSLNRQNLRKAVIRSTSGFLGVSWNKRCCKWVAEIKTNGVSRHLGLFATPELAHAAYVAAKRLHHPFCTI